jgi:hypothetical protein
VLDPMLGGGMVTLEKVSVIEYRAGAGTQSPPASGSGAPAPRGAPGQEGSEPARG